MQKTSKRLPWRYDVMELFKSLKLKKWSGINADGDSDDFQPEVL